MKVSVVTISFNQADFLPACIESVLGQDYEDLEYIVVDSGSTDGSREIITRYSPRIAQVIFEPDGGPADGLNKGFRYATGEVFGYINADDILLPGAIRVAVECFSRNPVTDIVFGNGLQLDEDGAIVRKLFSTNWDLRRYAYGACNILQQATFFRRGAFERASGFNVENRTCWDGELLVDMAIRGAKLARKQEFIGGFRVHSNSITGSARLLQPYLMDLDRINKKILGRPLTSLDRLWAIVFRIEKLLRHPRAALSSFGNRFMMLAQHWNK